MFYSNQKKNEVDVRWILTTCQQHRANSGINTNAHSKLPSWRNPASSQMLRIIDDTQMIEKSHTEKSKC